MAKISTGQDLSVSSPVESVLGFSSAVEGVEIREPSTPPGRVPGWEIGSAAVCIAIALYAAILPVYRACLLVEVSYNEGWNAYNAEALAHHLFLYTARYAWTTVNYPILSFYLIAHLSRFTHDFLFTGRVISIVSLMLSGVLVGLTVRKLTGAMLPSILAGFFVIGVFCANADFYVGVNDPQLLAQVFFVAGLLLYVWRRQSLGALAVVALLFVLGGNIKHNMIDIPFAVMLDLALVSRKRLLQFSIVGAALVSMAMVLNVRIGGPFFVAQILTPRLYAVGEIWKRWVEFYPTILIPFLAAIVTSVRIAKNPSLRIVSLLFWISLAVGMGFSGGHGVAINAFFSNTVAITILLGILFAQARTASERWPGGWQRVMLRAGVPLVFFVWLFIPLACNDNLLFWKSCAKVEAAQTRFARQVALLRAQPGPALCESLLRCYVAGKPYVYDPFNSTSLIRQGKLDGGVILAGIENKQYGAIQFDRAPLPDGRLLDTNQRFVDPIVEATARNYRSELSNDDCAIYLPRQSARQSAK